MINNIKIITISEVNAKKKINELNKIKKVETKGKRLIISQKTLLSLFDDLVKAILIIETIITIIIIIIMIIVIIMRVIIKMKV